MAGPRPRVCDYTLWQPHAGFVETFLEIWKTPKVKEEKTSLRTESTFDQNPQHSVNLFRCYRKRTSIRHDSVVLYDYKLEPPFIVIVRVNSSCTVTQ